MKKWLNITLCLFLTIIANAQTVAPTLLQKQWEASWISVPDEPIHDYGVYLFRKTLELSVKPAAFVAHVSADNRYKLFVNGQLVSLGPARGDLNHWNFETVDIAAFLRAGKNIVAAQVWNEGDWRPEAQISLRTGFILQGATAAESAVNTNSSWKCMRDNSYSPLKVSMRTYYVSGPGERIQMELHPKNWQNTDFQDAAWKNAQTLFPGVPKTVKGPYGTVNGWMLTPSSIPQMEMKPERFGKVLRADGVVVPGDFPIEKKSLTFPANTVATILLDQTCLTNAYPTLVFSGGKGASISLEYAEALFTKYPAKGNRNETAGKQMIGRKDSILSDGSAAQIFTTLSFRTYRFVQVTVRTQAEPLVLDDIYGTFTGYPFQFNATLESERPEMDQMLEIGWRTARLCAVETYFDCPYYEQLQYIGDTRIQGLVSIYNSGDERLLRNALNQMDQSRQPEGVTLSRHPSYTPQYIPTFSLWYVGMLHDYSRYGREVDFVKNKLPGMRQVMDYFRGYQLPDGSLKDVPHWMFTDWVDDVKGWVSGVGPMSDDGTSALLDLQLLWAYQLAADLENKLGMKDYAALYNGHAGRLKMSIQNKYWNPARKLYADRAEKDFYSQHANTLAILTGMVQGAAARQLAEQLTADTSLAPASIYFKYYLHEALIKAGFGNDYLNWLDIWRENIAMGLSTWAEISDIDAARSDCHAWGSSPNIEFFRTVLGIDSDGPGFSQVKIEPHLGDLKKISGSIPHRNGTVSVSYDWNNGQWNVQIELPPGTTGTLVWKDKRMALKAGVNKWII